DGGQPWTPAWTLPHVRDGLCVRSRATLCPCGRSSMRHPAHRQFLRNALPDLTTIAPATAYYRINYVRDTGGLWNAATGQPAGGGGDRDVSPRGKCAVGTGHARQSHHLGQG